MNKSPVHHSLFPVILSGAFSNLSMRIIGVFVTLGLNIYMAQYYGAIGIGTLVLMIALIEVGALLIKCGFNIALVKWIPEHLAKYSFSSAAQLFRKCLVIILWTGLGAGIFIWFTSGFIGRLFFKEQLSGSLFVQFIALLILISAINDLFRDTLRGLKKINAMSFLESILPSGIQWGALIFLTYYFFDKHNPVYSFIIALLTTGLSGLFLIRKLLLKKKNGEEIGCQKSMDLIKNAFPFYIIAIAQISMFYSDTLILGFFKNEKEVGLFTIAFRIAGYTSFMLAAVNMIAAPVFSELFHSGKTDELKIIAKKSARFISWVSMPVYLIILIVGREILSLFGEEFIPAYIPLVCIATGQFFNAFSGSVGNLLMMTSYHKVVQNIHIFSALLNLILSILLVPYFGINGAAVSTMLSVIAANVYSTREVKKKLGYYIFWGTGFER